MQPGSQEIRWSYLVLVMLVAIDGLVIYRAIQRLVLHEGTISPDAPLFLLLLMALQVLLLVLFFRFRTVLGYYQRLRESHENELQLTRQLMNSVEVALSVQDEHGRFVYANKATADLLGIPAENLLGRNARDFLVEYEGKEVKFDFPASNLESSEMVYAVTLHGASGKRVPLQVKVTPRWHAGRVVGSICSVLPQ